MSSPTVKQLLLTEMEFAALAEMKNDPQSKAANKREMLTEDMIVMWLQRLFD
jgi:hypothetical protein